MKKLSLLFMSALIALIPLEYAIHFEWVGSITRPVGALALLFTFLQVLHTRRVRKLAQIHLLMVLFVFWGMISYFWSRDSASSAGSILTFAQLLMLVWLVWETGRNEAGYRLMLNSYILGAAVVAATTIVGFFAGWSGQVIRQSVLGFDPNDMALTLAIAVPIAWGRATESVHSLWSWGFRIYVGMAVLAIMLSGSRGGLVALAVAVAAIVLSITRMRIGQRIVLVGLALATTYALSRVVPQDLWARFGSIPAELQGGTLSQRTYIWRAGLEAFTQTPLLGVGVGAYPGGVYQLLGLRAVAHNTFLSVLVEQGIIGLGLLLLLLGGLVLLSRRLSPAERVWWFTAMAVWGLGASVLTWEVRKTTWLLFSLLVVKVSTQEAALKRTKVEGPTVG